MQDQYAASAVGAQSPSVHVLAADSVKGSDDAETSCQTEQTQPFTDEEREVAIAAAGLEVQECMARYGSSSDLSDRGAADRARIRMQNLIMGRSHAKVAEMLITQAVRMAREPGAEQA